MNCNNKMHIFSKSIKGLTLVELLVVLSMMVIVLISASAHLTRFLSEQKVHAELIELQSTIRMAKSKAMANVAPVVLCPSKSQDQCDTDNWNHTMILFFDDNDDEKIQNHSDLIATIELSSQIDLVWSGFPPTDYIRFKPDGHITSYNGTFVACQEHGKNRTAQGLIVSRNARTRLTEGQKPVHSGADDKPLKC